MQDMRYETCRDDLIEILGVNLVSDPTLGEQYVVRSTLLRLWNQVFQSVKGSKILSQNLDQLDWNNNLDNLRDLILTLDQQLETASVYREQKMDLPKADIVQTIKDKSSFLGQSVLGLIKNMSRLVLIPNPTLSSPFVFFKSIDWAHVAHLTSYDADLVTVRGFLGDLQFYDIPPIPIEVALKVSREIIMKCGRGGSFFTTID